MYWCLGREVIGGVMDVLVSREGGDRRSDGCSSVWGGDRSDGCISV